MKRFQDLQIGDIVGVLRLGGNNVMDFKLNFKEYNGYENIWHYEISYYSKDNMEFDIDNKNSFIVIDDFLIFPMDNWEELHEIYKFGKTDGQLCLKYSIENLLKRY